MKRVQYGKNATGSKYVERLKFRKSFKKSFVNGPLYTVYSFSWSENLIDFKLKINMVPDKACLVKFIYFFMKSIEKLIS